MINPTNQSAWRAETFLGAAREQFADKTILIAGCGAEGSHCAVGLGSLMMHATGSKLLLTDPETFETGNLGIQLVDTEYLGVNKAVAVADMLAKKFPGVELEVSEAGITHENAAELVEKADYVVDGTDVFITDVASTMHTAANAQETPVVLPWSLGQGAALLAFDKRGGFDECEPLATELAAQAGHSEINHIARWLVHVPQGITKQYIVDMLAGKVPTPTTLFGNQTGGTLATLWIAQHLTDPASVPYYPEVVVSAREGLHSCTIKEPYVNAVKRALAELQ